MYCPQALICDEQARAGRAGAWLGLGLAATNALLLLLRFGSVARLLVASFRVPSFYPNFRLRCKFGVKFLIALNVMIFCISAGGPEPSPMLPSFFRLLSVLQRGVWIAQTEVPFRIHRQTPQTFGPVFWAQHEFQQQKCDHPYIFCEYLLVSFISRF